jgi:iron complex outermembrane receptor protein
MAGSMIAVMAAMGFESVSAQQLEEIVVVAQKREQSLQDVGISVNAFAGEDLERFNVTDATDVAKFSPGVHIAGSIAGQFTTFAIRGVTQNDFLDHTEAPTAVYVDEGYISAMQGQSLVMFDVERLEVVKGPQGTLFGRNATGGAVNIITRKPTDEFEGYVSAGYGSYDSINFDAAVSGSISDKLRARAAVTFRDNSSYVDNLFPGGDDLGSRTTMAGRVHLAFDPSDNLEILLSAYVADTEQSTGPYQSQSTRNVLDGDGNIINSVDSPLPTLLGTVDPEGFPLRHDFSDKDANQVKGHGASLRIDWDLGDFQIVSLTDYKDLEKDFFLDADATEVFAFNTVHPLNNKNFSQEIRALGELEDVRWTTGAYYLRIESEVPGTGLVVPGFALLDDYTLDTDSYSAFGQVEWDFAETLTLIGGVRVTQEEKDFDYESNLYASTGDTLNPRGALLMPNRPSFSDKASDTLVTGKLQLEWRPSDTLLMYAGFNRGVKAGSFNAPFGGSPLVPEAEIPYGKEVLHAYEIGFKSEFLDNRLRLNGSAYYYDYKNYQAFKLIGLTTQVLNADASYYGAELEATMRLSEGLTAFLGASYIDTTVKDVNFFNIVKDREAAYTPDFQINGILSYERPIGDGIFGAQIEGYYTGSYFYSLTNFDSTKVSGYGLLNARVSYEYGPWTVSGFVENITDKEYVSVGFDLSGATGNSEQAFGKPRWAGVNLKVRF